MDYEAIVQELKNNPELRNKVTEWVNSTNPEKLIKEWFEEQWNESITEHLDVDKLPDGYNWKVESRGVHTLTLTYNDFNDREMTMEMMVFTSGTPGCCECIAGISFDCFEK